jgi:hypothetical protein
MKQGAIKMKLIHDIVNEVGCLIKLYGDLLNQFINEIFRANKTGL